MTPAVERLTDGGMIVNLPRGLAEAEKVATHLQGSGLVEEWPRARVYRIRIDGRAT